MSSWSLRVAERYRESIRTGEKTIDLRMHTARNAQLIEKLLQFKKGDQLRFEFPHHSHGDLITEVTKASELKQIAELTEEELQHISGQTDLTREELTRVLRSHYRTEAVTDQTSVHLVHFQTDFSDPRNAK